MSSVAYFYEEISEARDRVSIKRCCDTYVFNSRFTSKNLLVVAMTSPTAISATASVNTPGVFPNRTPYFFIVFKSTWSNPTDMVPTTFRLGPGVHIGKTDTIY